MEVIATAKNVRISPQKVRLVVAQIKKMSPDKAIEILEFVPQKASKPLKKAIASAVANARNNFDLDTASLSFSEINVGKGISFKRYRPVSRGRAHTILRQTSNIRIVLKGEKAKHQNVKQIETTQKQEPKEETNGTKS